MSKRVHFLGIAGSGASAAAAIAQAYGFKITGCDKNLDPEFTKPFKKDQLFTGHNPKHLASNLRGCNVNPDPDSVGTDKVGVNILAVTPAVLSLDPQNPEIEEAKKRGIEILTWQQFLGKYLLKDKFVIAVCGTHGKSTTTAMIGQMLEDAGLDPTVELGAIVPRWGSNFRAGKGKHFVVEADEFNDNFLNYIPNITVVTNIEMDHPEYFKGFDNYKQSFYQFFLKTKDALLANLSDSTVSELVKHLMKGHASIGKGESTHKFVDRPKSVQCLNYSKNHINFPLKVIGEHNKLNAQAALQVGLILRIEPAKIRTSLSNYTGICRRFEYLGEYKGAKIYSDFGHHPTEIRTTMQAARENFPDNRIILVYEPHMFSRTKALFDDFVKVFRSLPVAETIILDIYPSREVDTGLVKSWQIVQSVKKSNVKYNSQEEIRETLNREIKKGDIVFFMGAGDIDKLARKLVDIE